MQSTDGGLALKPVLIYIHGGAWKFGDSTDRFYGPDFLLSQDNVVVTIQYRLGMFGLLNLGTSEYSGNMALKDQQLAFKWVWNNIANFAGDKQKILLFGESSGALNENQKIQNILFLRLKKMANSLLGGSAVHLHMLNKV